MTYRWPGELDDKLLRLRDFEKLSYRDIAERVNRSADTVRTRILHLKAKFGFAELKRQPRWTAEDDARLLRLVAETKTSRLDRVAIGKALGRTARGVAWRLEQLNVRPAFPSHPARETISEGARIVVRDLAAIESVS